MFRADTGADIFLSRTPQELISPWRKKQGISAKKVVKIKKVDFLHNLPDSNQNRTKDTAKNFEISIFTPSISIKNGVSVKLSKSNFIFCKNDYDPLWRAGEHFDYTPANFVCGGDTVFTLSVRACVRQCVRQSVRP